MRCAYTVYDRHWRPDLTCSRPATIERDGMQYCERHDPRPKAAASEPIPGVESPFYAGDRYYANAEDARRARLDLRASQQVTP